MSASSMARLDEQGDRDFLFGPYAAASSSSSRSLSTLQDPYDEKLLAGVEGADCWRCSVSTLTMLGRPVSGPSMLRIEE